MSAKGKDYHQYRFYLPPEVRECLRRHSIAQGVPLPKFARDLLTAWCAWATDWNQGIFTGKDLALEPLEPFGFPKEPMPNYLAKMGFSPDDV